MPARRRSTKPPKDPNAPKKYQSSYFLYSNERRAPLREQYPQKAVTDISKLISAEWKTISDETKQSYTERAKQCRETYEKKMGEYMQTEKYSQFQAKLNEWKSEQKQKENQKQESNSNSNSNSKNKKKHKTPAPKKPKPPADMPKKSQTSYFLFSNDVRPRLREQNPKMPLTKIAGLISQEWKKITPEQKSHYEVRAKSLKEKYENEMITYKQTQQYKDHMVRVTQFKADKKAHEKSARNPNVNGVEIKVKLPRKPKDENCPKKSQSSYFIFAALVRAEVKAANPGLKLTDIAKKISLRWKALSDEQRAEFSEQAKILKVQYVLDLAAYKQTQSHVDHQKTLIAYEAECKRLQSEAKQKAMQAYAANQLRERKESNSSRKKNRSRYHTDSDSSSSSDSGSSSSGSSRSSSSDSGSSSGSSGSSSGSASSSGNSGSSSESD